MATYNGDEVAIGARLRGTVLRDGVPAGPLSPDELSGGESIQGLVLGEGERVRLAGLNGADVAFLVVPAPARERARRGLAAALGRVQAATRAGEVAAPIDVQRLVLALVRETFGGES